MLHELSRLLSVNKSIAFGSLQNQHSDTVCSMPFFFFKVTQLCTIYEYLSYWYIRVFIIFWSCTVLLLELFYEFLFFNAL